MSSPADDEWSLLAEGYEDVTVTRFQPMHQCMAKYAVDHILNQRNGERTMKVLDFGTGPGEPVLSLLKQCIANKIDNVDLVGTDPSPKMLELAEARLKEINGQHPSIRFYSVDQYPNEKNTFDIILSSLVLIYASDQSQMLRDFHDQLRDGGLLITSHWPQLNQVPFLTLLKQIGAFMATGQRVARSDMKPDASFSLWSEEETKKLFTTQGYTIQQWTTIDLPMRFPNIRTFLSFCRIARWFGEPDQYAKAEAELQRILRDDYHLEVQPNDAFELPSKAVVIVASYSSH